MRMVILPLQKCTDYHHVLVARVFLNYSTGKSETLFEDWNFSNFLAERLLWKGSMMFPSRKLSASGCLDAAFRALRQAVWQRDVLKPHFRRREQFGAGIFLFMSNWGQRTCHIIQVRWPNLAWYWYLSELVGWADSRKNQSRFKFNLQLKMLLSFGRQRIKHFKKCLRSMSVHIKKEEILSRRNDGIYAKVSIK